MPAICSSRRRSSPSSRSSSLRASAWPSRGGRNRWRGVRLAVALLDGFGAALERALALTDSPLLGLDATPARSQLELRRLAQLDQLFLAGEHGALAHGLGLSLGVLDVRFAISSPTTSRPSADRAPRADRRHSCRRPKEKLPAGR
jgi:hypothetical protein